MNRNKQEPNLRTVRDIAGLKLYVVVVSKHQDGRDEHSLSQEGGSILTKAVGCTLSIYSARPAANRAVEAGDGIG